MGGVHSSDEVEVNDGNITSLCGWRVLKVQRLGPCDGLGLVPYFDVITHINEKRLDDNEHILMQAITPNQTILIDVFSLSTHTSRSLSVTPSRWIGEGLLGLMIRYDNVESSDLECMHVLNVYPHSPASDAGLQPYSDWLLGTERLAFKGWDQLDHWLGQSNDRVSTICVFNSSTWRIREIPIKPSSRWGGKGALGCDLAQGYKHRLTAFNHSSRRHVMMDHRSEIRLSATSQSSDLHREDEQLMMHINVNDVMMYIRIREPEEMAVRSMPIHNPASNQSLNHAHSQHINQISHSHIPISSSSSPQSLPHQSISALPVVISTVPMSHQLASPVNPAGKRVLHPKLPPSISAISPHRPALPVDMNEKNVSGPDFT